jgi:predicted dinucleotide-binding enzyme
MHMKIGIIGAGAIGTALARNFARNGIDVVIANRRGPATLAALALELGPHITAVTAKEAAQRDIVIVAINWGSVPSLKELGPWEGRIVVDANNAIEVPSFRAVDLQGRASSDVLAGYVAGASVVKAFNHLGAALLAQVPREGGGRRVLFYSGNDAAAKDKVAGLIARLGFAGVDLGTPSDGGRLAQFPGGVLPNLNFIKLN